MMALSAVRFISLLNSRRLICTYRSPLTLQLRHLSGRLTSVGSRNCRVVSLGQQKFLRLPEEFSFRHSLVRWNSSSSSSAVVQNADIPLQSHTEPFIPEPPLPVDSNLGPEIVEQLTALGEPTLQSLGLASWYPNGLVQSGLEAIHVGLNVPWWTSIVIGTVILRVVIFPLFIYVQRQMIIYNNHMPVVQKLQEQMTRARRHGDMLEASRAGVRMYTYMKENKVNPLKNFIGPLSQMPIFLSVFIGIRQMANLPVESMKTGGIAWFPDLTVSDPYFALPIMTVALLYATIEVGVDGVRAASMPRTGRVMMRVMPFFILPFIMNFPAGMLCYWLTSNCVSLVQAAFLRIPKVRQTLNIPKMDVMKQSPKSNKSFIERVKDGYKHSKMVDAETLQREEATRFKEAGFGAVPKTYPYDPTKVQKIVAAKAKNS